MKCFLDTNILCYAIDEKDKTKQLLAQKLLNSLLFRDTFVQRKCYKNCTMWLQQK